MEDNKQIIYHKSDWGKQVIYIVLVLAFIFFSYKKNPTKELFTQELIREYAVKNGLDTSSSMWVSELTNTMFGGLVEPLVKRNDYVIFSTFEIELNNQYIKGKVNAIGFWDNIIFYDAEKKNQTSISGQDNSISKENDTTSVSAPIYPVDREEVSSVKSYNEDASSPAMPDFKMISITNSSNYTVYLAYSFYDDGWETIGWINVEPKGNNIINLPSSFKGDSIYWYAENSNGGKWSNTNNYFCVSHPNAFHYYDSENCSEKVGFYKLNLTGRKTELCCFEVKSEEAPPAAPLETW